MPNPGVDLGADRGTDHGLLLNQEADHQTDLRPGQEVVQEVNRGRLIRINQEIKEPIPEKNQGLLHVLNHTVPESLVHFRSASRHSRSRSESRSRSRSRADKSRSRS